MHIFFFIYQYIRCPRGLDFYCQNCDLVCRQFFFVWIPNDTAASLVLESCIVFWRHDALFPAGSCIVFCSHYVLCSAGMHVLYCVIVFFRHHALCSAVIIYRVLQALCIVSCRLMHCVLQSSCIVFCRHYALCPAGIMHCVMQAHALCSAVMHVFNSIIVFCRHHALCSAVIMCYVIQTLCIVFCSHACVLQYH